MQKRKSSPMIEAFGLLIAFVYLMVMMTVIGFAGGVIVFMLASLIRATLKITGVI
jgi:hypothetical protein